MSVGLTGLLMMLPVKNHNEAHGWAFSGDESDAGSCDILKCGYYFSQMHAMYLFCLRGFSLQRECNFLHSKDAHGKGGGGRRVVVHFY